MGPIVPILRLAYLFLNIYDTYKVLKPPTPSARSGGQPSVRAMTQRKRDMKGVMTVWTVWVCLHPSSALCFCRHVLIALDSLPGQCGIATYESTVDPLIIYFPFYNEIKSIFLVFFIFTRARVSTSTLTLVWVDRSLR